MITYTTDVAAVDVTHLEGPFFVGWPDPPDATTHLAILRGSSRVVLAWADDRVVGFATALTDGVLAAFVPLLEVTPTHQGRGIGAELVRRLVAELEPLYAIDAICDPELVPFYERLGFVAIDGVARRDRSVQSGRRS